MGKNTERTQRRVCILFGQDLQDFSELGKGVRQTGNPILFIVEIRSRALGHPLRTGDATAVQGNSRIEG
jgi:hypothetical protein